MTRSRASSAARSRGSAAEGAAETRLGRERRAAILAVARTRFLADGYAATSMSDIAQRLGGSKGTLYAYFPSKEALFHAVAQQRSAELQAELFDLDVPERPARDRLFDLAGRLLAALLRPDNVDFQRLIIAESGRFPELGRAFLETGPRIVRGRIADILEPMMARGELRAADPDEAAELFADLTISGAMLRRLWGTPNAPGEALVTRRVAASVEVFLSAYAP